MVSFTQRRTLWFFGDFPFLKMQAVRMQDVAHPVDSDCEGFDSNIVLAPQRCTYIIEGTFRTAEPAGQILGQRMEDVIPFYVLHHKPCVQRQLFLARIASTKNRTEARNLPH